MTKSEIRSFRKAVRRFEQLASQQTRTCCTGVTLAQCHALLQLEALGETTVQGLARALHLQKNTVSWTVDGLVKRGLVRRSPDPSDRRAVLLSLTGEGRERCDAINKINDKHYSEVFDRIPRDSRRAVVEKFTLLVEALEDNRS